MRIGLAVPQYGAFANPEAVIEVSRAAEAMGFDSLWAGDRILNPINPSNPYPTNDGVMPREFAIYLEPLSVLTLASAHTERVRLGTSTLNAPWYPPVLLARALTTLDVLSSGRLDAGFGLGWLEDEYTAVNVPWEDRGARFDETLDVLEKIWFSDVIEHNGPLFTIPPTKIMPKPKQGSRLPILLGGYTPVSLRRVGREPTAGWESADLWSTSPACGRSPSGRPRPRAAIPPACASSFASTSN
ncbi:TIGR03619 family F420-dependent LLM class oxidoreductase [Streptosporangium lutulentum]